MSASVHFDSSVPVWKQPKFLRLVQEEAEWLSKCAGPGVSVKLSPGGCAWTLCDCHFVATFAYGGTVFGAVTYCDLTEEGVGVGVPGSRAREYLDSVPVERVRGWLENFLQSKLRQRLAHFGGKLRGFENATAARREAGAP